MSRICTASILVLASAFEFRFDLSIGTRASPLAIKQAELVEAALSLTAPGTMTRLVSFSSGGDADLQAAPLAKAGVRFTTEIDAAVLGRAVDIGVHSLKDIPPQHRWTTGLTIGCHLPRASPLDVLIGSTSLDMLSAGARVGTASIRRHAQLKAARPDLEIVNVRGSVEARLDMLDTGHVQALVLAKAGLERLGLHDRAVSELPPGVMLPGVGQGIICAVCRDDADALRLLRAADDPDTHLAATAERAFLNVIDAMSPWEGRPPLGALMARSQDGSSWGFHGLVAQPDGSRVVRVERSALAAECGLGDAAAFGKEAAEELLAHAGADFLHH